MNNPESNRELLSDLIVQSKSMQVLAFEVIPLESLYDYVEWAVACLGMGFDNALQPIISHYGESNINYFEIMEDLRSFTIVSRIIPPRGVDAVELYCLGCVLDVVNDVATEIGMLQHISDLLRSHKSVRGFGLIAELYNNYWKLPNGESCDDILRSFRKEAERIAKEMYVELKLCGGYWQLKVIVDFP